MSALRKKLDHLLSAVMADDARQTTQLQQDLARANYQMHGLLPPEHGARTSTITLGDVHHHPSPPYAPPTPIPSSKTAWAIAAAIYAVLAAMTGGILATALNAPAITDLIPAQIPAQSDSPDPEWELEIVPPQKTKRAPKKSVLPPEPEID